MSDSPIEAMQKLVAQNELAQAIKKIREEYQVQSLDTREIDLVESRFENLKQKLRLTLISDGAAGLERSKIASALLDYIDILKR